MERVTTILERKEAHFHTISPDKLITEALHQMRCENVDHLVVIDEEERFLGMLTDHDIATKVIFSSRPLKEIKVQDIMNTRLPVVTVEDTVEKCMKMMKQHGVRFLPVFEDFNFKGVVTSEDILHEVISNRMKIFDPEQDWSYKFA